jgi:hypothetical protein
MAHSDMVKSSIGNLTFSNTIIDKGLSRDGLNQLNFRHGRTVQRPLVLANNVFPRLIPVGPTRERDNQHGAACVVRVTLIPLHYQYCIGFRPKRSNVRAIDSN